MNSIYTTKHWRELRDSILGDHECECSICGKKRWKFAPRKKQWRIQGRWALHHLTYDRAGGEETADDVTPLCYSCHQTLHFIMDNKSSAPIIIAIKDIIRRSLYENKEPLII